ncbi:hypothetical protein [Helicobacter sp. MIT 05-5294]|nr:hypothetical protein [Helicobacter sp. MIT 05-5294]
MLLGFHCAFSLKSNILNGFTAFARTKDCPAVIVRVLQKLVAIHNTTL